MGNIVVNTLTKSCKSDCINRAPILPPTGHTKIERTEEACREFFMRSGPTLDPAHDLGHVERVNQNQKLLSLYEGGDQEVLVPAALLHDIVNHPKNSPLSKQSAADSADLTRAFLENLSWYPKAKIILVSEAIRTHSFSAKTTPTSIEGALLQDADLLESSGVIGLMRTFVSCGVLGKILFHPTDPFCTQRSPNPSQFAFDLYYARLIKVRERLNTGTAILMINEREQSLRQFVMSWENEGASNRSLDLRPIGGKHV